MPRLSDNVMHHVAMDIGQSEITASHPYREAPGL